MRGEVTERFRTVDPKRITLKERGGIGGRVTERCPVKVLFGQSLVGLDVHLGTHDPLRKNGFDVLRTLFDWLRIDDTRVNEVSMFSNLRCAQWRRRSVLDGPEQEDDSKAEPTCGEHRSGSCLLISRHATESYKKRATRGHPQTRPLHRRVSQVPRPCPVRLTRFGARRVAEGWSLICRLRAWARTKPSHRAREAIRAPADVDADP